MAGDLVYFVVPAADAERAKAFYGALFGWKPEPFGPATMFRLPGYFGGEPSQPVPRDVVAILLPASDGAPGWGVDFWIADIDAAVAKVAGLGGRVVAPAHDVPPMFRQAVLADPEGGTFSISQLMV